MRVECGGRKGGERVVLRCVEGRGSDGRCGLIGLLLVSFLEACSLGV